MDHSREIRVSSSSVYAFRDRSDFSRFVDGCGEKSRMARSVNYGRSEGAWEHH